MFSLLVYQVTDLFSGVEPVRYSQVLEIDRKISEHVTVSHLQVPPDGSSMETDGPLLIMQRVTLSICSNARKSLSILSWISFADIHFASAHVHTPWLLRESLTRAPERSHAQFVCALLLNRISRSARYDQGRE